MTETSMPFDWGFDPMNPGPGPAYNLEPSVASDEELWYRNQLGMNNFDMSQWQPDINPGYEIVSPMAGKTPYQASSSLQTGFPNQTEKPVPRYA